MVEVIIVLSCFVFHSRRLWLRRHSRSLSPWLLFRRLCVRKETVDHLNEERGDPLGKGVEVSPDTSVCAHFRVCLRENGLTCKLFLSF